MTRLDLDHVTVDYRVIDIRKSVAPPVLVERRLMCPDVNSLLYSSFEVSRFPVQDLDFLQIHVVAWGLDVDVLGNFGG